MRINKIHNKTSVYSLYFKAIERQYIYSSTYHGEFVLLYTVYRRYEETIKCYLNNQSHSLLAIGLWNCVLNCEQHFSYFDTDHPTYELTVSGLERVDCTLSISTPALLRHRGNPQFHSAQWFLRNKPSAARWFPSMLRNLTVYSHVNKSQQLVSTMSHMNPIRIGNPTSLTSTLILSSRLRLGLPSSGFPIGIK
jgi:hypothetical protein